VFLFEASGHPISSDSLQQLIGSALKELLKLLRIHLICYLLQLLLLLLGWVRHVRDPGLGHLLNDPVLDVRADLHGLQGLDQLLQGAIRLSILPFDLEGEVKDEGFTEEPREALGREVAVLVALDPVAGLGREALLAELLKEVDLVHQGLVVQRRAHLLGQTRLRPQVLLPVLHPSRFYYRILLLYVLI